MKVLDNVSLIINPIWCWMMIVWRHDSNHSMYMYLASHIISPTCESSTLFLSYVYPSEHVHVLGSYHGLFLMSIHPSSSLAHVQYRDGSVDHDSNKVTSNLIDAIKYPMVSISSYHSHDLLPYRSVCYDDRFTRDILQATIDTCRYIHHRLQSHRLKG